ncbi:MAG: ABC transporter ATP-binding protein [Candidatus Nanopelagicales bacterium]|nr:ABC transporter ATP-binding protein [Candidatus Nanopelagicales bacterium]
MTDGSVNVRQLAKSYGEVEAVRGIDLDIAGGEFFSLLGPSGCGKTTTLRMIAGFETPTSGEIRIDGVDVVQTAAHERPVNTVFQNYALFPFLSVADNVAFGLRYQQVDKAGVKRKVAEALEMVRMGQYAKRKPGQLSGGQQQRVALARAIVLGPKVLLLDEPLGALDAKLRKTLQVELKSLQQSVGITFVYVTHDQEEALTMSDRMAVMAAGKVEQIGSPADVYENPETAYVADFLGSANVVNVEVIGAGAPGRTAFRLGSVTLEAGGPTMAPGPGTLVIRPERIYLDPTADDAVAISATVERTVYLGAMSDVVVRLESGQELVVRKPSELSGNHHRGEKVMVHLRPNAMRLVPAGALTDANAVG